MSDILVVALFLLGIFVFFVLVKQGAFSLHFATSPAPFFLVTPLGAFFLYIFCLVCIPPLAEHVILYGDMHGWSSFSEVEVKNLALLTPLPLAWLVLVLFCRLHPTHIQRTVWGKERGILAHMRKFGTGVVFAASAYPVIILTVLLLHALVRKLTGEEIHEQIALEHLRSVQEISWLFISYAVAIIVIVPVIEELLFRGFLQNYLTSRFGYRWGIIFASCVFAFFHYSTRQGAANFGLIISLFLFSCLMGIVYIRKQSLYATIGMHTTFNALSIVLIILTG